MSPCPAPENKRYLSTEACQKLVEPVTYEEVLVNRFRPFLSEIIGPLQGGFIPGRGTTENIIIAQEIMHFMRNTKSQKGTMAFKIDLEKAYNRVGWHFLEATLVRFGFSKATINLILNCVTSSSLAVLWNRNRLQNFNPKRGLRQGYPMSPYLFVLCMEMLACFISHRVFQGLWNPVAVSRNGPRLSHLIFADDLLLFYKASKAQVIEVKHCLDLFSRASGLKVNLHKSKAQCSKRVSERRKEVLSRVSNIRFCNYLGKYLRNNIGHARASRKTAQEFLWKGHATGKGLLPGQVLKHKYIKNQSSMNGNSRNSSSATWKNIVSAYEHLSRKGFIGIMGMSTNQFDFIVADLWKGVSWEADSLTTSIMHEIKQFICGMRYLSLTELEPQWEWWPVATKKYSTREGYRWLLEKTLNWNANNNWNWLWNTNIPEKFKFTMWLGLHDALPIEIFRFKRHLASLDMCKRCNKAQETMEHCLRDCE
ncbi:uncharacterized protein LOC130956727 [Arachis stenosperma]|uniref:uncharacterized protein LOC130956727 n=1 Tax=Arachis stenosperma TaxID=217475 RepID=UPI0025AC7796|nr:uncharacterized protein LOC130956727 [Arachis stenosperma]